MSQRGSIDTLITKIKQGKIKDVKKLIEQGVNINDKGGGYRSTPLHAAVESGEIDIMNYLIDKGSDLTATDAGSYNPLMSVVQKIYRVDSDLYRLSLPKQRYISTTIDPNTGKMIKGHYVNEDRSDKLKEQQKEIKETKERQKNRFKAIKQLLEKTVQNGKLDDVLKQEDMHGLNAIQLSYRGRPDVIKQLLDYGADPKNILENEYFAGNTNEMILRLLMDYAIKDPKYQPNKNAHPRVKELFIEYKTQIGTEILHLKKLSKKINLPQNTVFEMKNYLTTRARRITNARSSTKKSPESKSSSKKKTIKNKKEDK